MYKIVYGYFDKENCFTPIEVLGSKYEVASEMLDVCKQIRRSLQDTDAVRHTSHALELSKLDYIIDKAERKE